jgi:hypothetical protein
MEDAFIMKRLLKWEDISQLLLFFFIYKMIFKFSILDLFIFISLPDSSALAYLINERVGAKVYNILHHLSLPSILLIIGLSLHIQLIIMAALILFIHIYMDRTFGFGLKFNDSFKHTHLSNRR